MTMNKYSYGILISHTLRENLQHQVDVHIWGNVWHQSQTSVRYHVCVLVDMQVKNQVLEKLYFQTRENLND